SERDPCEEPQCVVIDGIGAGSVEVVPSPVELAVQSVLNADARIHERAKRALAIGPEGVVELAHNAVAIRQSVPIENIGIVGAVNVECRQGQPDPVVQRVSTDGANLVEVVVAACWIAILADQAKDTACSQVGMLMLVAKV